MIKAGFSEAAKMSLEDAARTRRAFKNSLYGTFLQCAADSEVGESSNEWLPVERGSEAAEKGKKARVFTAARPYSDVHARLQPLAVVG
jgi:hypothetical protein